MLTLRTSVGGHLRAPSPSREERVLRCVSGTPRHGILMLVASPGRIPPCSDPTGAVARCAVGLDRWAGRSTPHASRDAGRPRTVAGDGLRLSVRAERANAPR